MPTLPSTISPALRTCARRQLALLSTCNVASPPLHHRRGGQQPPQQQRRREKSDVAATAYFESPFPKNPTQPTINIPDFGKYKSERPADTNLVFQYFMAGAFGMLTAAGAKQTVQDFLVNLSASADVLALAKVEVDLNTIPEGKNVIIKWRGKPVFIRHRTSDEIETAQKEAWDKLRDPESDEDRVKKPEWLVMIGVCTHLGCVPIGEAGDFGGWFCPCHGSHYDLSGRARKGPAPLNLPVPDYEFTTDTSIVIG